MMPASVLERRYDFALYGKDGVVDRFFLEYLKRLWPFVKKLVYISTSKLHQESVDSLKLMGVVLKSRNNMRYDFSILEGKVGSDLPQ
jgi:lipopolysaccharide biosynthesis protein